MFQVEHALWTHKHGSVGSANGWIPQSQPVIVPVKRSNDMLKQHHLPAGRKAHMFHMKLSGSTEQMATLLESPTTGHHILLGH